MNFLRNRWLWVFVAALWPVPVLWLAGVRSDTAVDWISAGVFVVFGGLAAIYSQRAPFAVKDGDFGPAARNAVGWLVLFVFFGAMIFYGWLFRNQGRPEWLSTQYWLAAIWWCIFVGALIMASSTRRNGAPLLGGRPTGFLFGVVTASVVFAANAGTHFLSFLGPLWRMLVGFLSRLG